MLTNITKPQQFGVKNLLKRSDLNEMFFAGKRFFQSTVSVLYRNETILGNSFRTSGACARARRLQDWLCSGAVRVVAEELLARLGRLKVGSKKGR